MTFFNKKEDVIEIKLTQFGKNLLSRGAFKPVYYQFFDDDIVYESSKSQGTEHQNKAEDRIKSSIRMRTVTVDTGVETRFDQETKKIRRGEAAKYNVLKRE